MAHYKGWKLTNEGIHYFARKGNIERKFSTVGARSDFLAKQP